MTSLCPQLLTMYQPGGQTGRGFCFLELLGDKKTTVAHQFPGRQDRSCREKGSLERTPGREKSETCGSTFQETEVTRVHKKFLGHKGPRVPPGNEVKRSMSSHVPWGHTLGSVGPWRNERDN